MSKNNLKQVICAICVCVFVITLSVGNFVYADEALVNNNPFSVTATELNEDGEFTVNINVSKDCVLEAYKVSVCYDGTVAGLCDGANKFGNYSAFLDKYNSNNKGICLNNHIEKDAKVIFAGAQPDAVCATLEAGDKVAYLNLKINEENQDMVLEEILKKINVTVENCSDGENDLVKLYPEEFSQALPIVVGDDKHGEEYLMGDMDFSGKVDLNDATLSLKGALAIISLDEKVIIVGDIDGDGKVTLTDTVSVLKMALGIL